mmetsp:Transcript_6672/g.23591  ORF Transcript_6672/g.23591 Transcript_6672/m.23591 type:complete len:266 (-) Transcript_6672:2000-2797(-)
MPSTSHTAMASSVPSFRGVMYTSKSCSAPGSTVPLAGLTTTATSSPFTAPTSCLSHLNLAGSSVRFFMVMCAPSCTPTYDSSRSTSFWVRHARGATTSARAATYTVFPPSTRHCTTVRSCPSSDGVTEHVTSSVPRGGSTPSAWLKDTDGSPEHFSERRHIAGTSDMFSSVSVASISVCCWTSPKSTLGWTERTSGPVTSAMTRSGSRGPCSMAHTRFAVAGPTAGCWTPTVTVLLSKGGITPELGHTVIEEVWPSKAKRTGASV